jgi:hypothetical protein
MKMLRLYLEYLRTSVLAMGFATALFLCIARPPIALILLLLIVATGAFAGAMLKWSTAIRRMKVMEVMPVPMASYAELQGGAAISVTSDLASEDEGSFLSQVRSVLPVHKVLGLAARSAEPGSAAHVVADVLTWTSVFKMAAADFLSQLKTNTAVEVWEKREKLLRALGTSVASPLYTLARAFSTINQRAKHADASIAFPYPNQFYGTVFSIRSTNEVEIAWLLANFVKSAEGLRTEIRQLLTSGAQPLTGFFVGISPECKITIWWFEIDGKKTHQLGN